MSSYPNLSRVANPGDRIEITHADGTTSVGDFFKTFPARGRKNGGVILWQLKPGSPPEKKSSYKSVTIRAGKGDTARVIPTQKGKK